MNKLTISGIVQNGVQIGLTNLAPLLVNVSLWIITIWIPYLNVGTTIGLVALVTKMGKKGESLSMTEIFNPVYRKRMGEFFLGSAFVSMGCSIGAMFVVIPGIVISIAWSLTLFLIVDRELNPMEAINQSNSKTYGHKWTMFWGSFILGLVVMIAGGILLAIFNAIGIAVLSFIISLAVAVCFISIMIGAQAYIYTTLTE